MRRVIFAWELGGHLGHLWRLLPVAEALRACEVEVLFAVTDLVSATRLIGGRGFSFVQAPKPGPSSVVRPRLLNYADILGQSGFDTPLNLAALVNGWRSLFGVFGPDCLLADHAPSAIVAGRTTDLPAVVLGTGFEVPPDIHPTPSFRVGEKVHAGRLLAADELVLRSVNSVYQASGKSCIQRVSDLFGGTRKLVTGYREMDHYGARDDVLYIGSLGVRNEGDRPQWPSVPGQRVFAYLHAAENMLALVTALTQLGNTSAIVVWPEMEDRRVEGAGEGVHVTSTPVRIDEIMPEADIIVTEAGFGTTAAALEQRKKIVLLPRTAEQWLLAARLAEQGLAKWLDSETVPYGLTDLIAEVINDRDRPPALSMQGSREQPVESVVLALLSCFNAGDPRLLRNK